MKRLFLIATATMTLSFAAANVLSHERHFGEHGMKAFLSQLDLSMTQKRQIRSQVSETRDELSVYRQDFRKLHQEMKSLMASGNVQQSSVVALLSQHQDTIKNIAKSRAKVKHVVWHTLDIQQQGKAESLKQAKLAKFSPEKMDAKMASVIESLELTEAQQQPVADALNVIKESRVGMRQRLMNFMAQQRDIVRASEFDEAAWEALFDAQFPQFTAMVSDMIEKRQIFLQLLTPEQQEKLPVKKGMRLLNSMMRD